MDHLRETWAASRPSRKRKLVDEDPSLVPFSLDELNQDLLERVLSWLPTSSFFRSTSVCKRWKSLAHSSSFKLACSEVPTRDPWFYMVDSHLNHSTVFDSAERSWKKLCSQPSLNPSLNCGSMPVAASGGLVCFLNDSRNFIVSNPVSGSSMQLPPLDPALPPLDPAPESRSLHAVAMTTCSEMQQPCYKIVLIYNELPRLACRVYNSSTGSWEEEISLRRNADESRELELSEEDCTMYFLSKTGNVVATNMQRSPSKQYSSVITQKNGECILYFLSSSGTIVACDIMRKSFSEYPRLLPVCSEYSIDLVECRGEMFAVVLSEFFDSASLRVWKFEESSRSWLQICAMPPAMSHEFYDKKVDINCVGAGDQMLICLNSADFFSYVICDLRINKWEELPKHFRNGEAVEFMSAFAFQPRIEATV